MLKYWTLLEYSYINNNDNNNGEDLYTAYPALALSGLQSIIILVLYVDVHLFNGQATYYTSGAYNHRLVTYKFNYQVAYCTCTLLGI